MKKQSTQPLCTRRQIIGTALCAPLLMGTAVRAAASQLEAKTPNSSGEGSAVKPTLTPEANLTSANEIAALYQPDGINFTIYRDDRRVGNHRVRFQVDGSELAVSIDSNIRITILKIPVFTLRYTASELWRDDQLISAEATTLENKNSNTVSLINQGNQSALVTLEGPKQVERLDYASNHWNSNILSAGRFFNTLTGEASDIRIDPMGEESITTTSGTRLAKHYQYTGDVVTEVWYDALGRWVGLAFNADDGSRIRYQLND